MVMGSLDGLTAMNLTPEASLYTFKGVLYLFSSDLMLMDRRVAQIKHQTDAYITHSNSIGEHD